MAVRALRGATQVDADDRQEILDRSAELVTAVLERNELRSDDIISIWFTATPDLTAEFPAYAARLLGLTDVPLMCATEMAVPSESISPPMVEPSLAMVMKSSPGRPSS